MKRNKWIFMLVFALAWFVVGTPDSSAAGPTIVTQNIDTPTAWTKEEGPYIVLNNIRVNASLSIEPGTIVKFKNRAIGISVKGELTAIGTPSERIIFTSVCDTAYGGDTKEYGDRCSNYPIKGEWNGIGMYDSAGKVSIEYALFTYAGAAISYQTTSYQLPYKQMSIKNSEIRDSFDSGIRIRNTEPTLESNIITGTRYYGVEVISEKRDRIPKLRNNAIFGNMNGIRAVTITGNPVSVDARYNWWGSVNGPSTSSYSGSGGKGDLVSGSKVDFTPWLTDPDQKAPEETLGCTENCFSNVLFLPGLEASRLYAHDDPDCMLINCENQLWEPNRNDDVRSLYLDSNGKSTDAYDIYTRDILDETNVAGQNIYESFIDRMNKMKNDDHLINDWAPAPYDWRLSLEDILSGGTSVKDGISYVNSTSTPRIIAELKRLAATSKTRKVTIVAHSNGGLLAKALMQKIGSEETKKLVDTVVLVAVPQIGTPLSVGAMLHGYDQSYLGGLILSKPTARGLTENMSSAYTLLPSHRYFFYVDTPLITFDSEKLPDWSARYGDVIHSQASMRNFLTDTYERVDAESSDIRTPSAIRGGLFDAADTRHDSLDNWAPPEGVKAVQIAGWGVPDTVSGMHYTTKTEVLCEHGICSQPHEVVEANPKFTIDGDGTVVTPSSLYLGGSERYWVDLKKYNTNHKIATILSELGGGKGVVHSDIFEVKELDTFIADIITKSTKSLSAYIYMSTQVPSSDDNRRLQYSLHSPLSLDLYDDEGRHTGLDANGNIEEQIPGTYYRQFGEVKYIFADELATQHLKLDGYDTGTFTLEVEEFEGDTSLGKVTFKDVPTTPETNVTMDTNNGLLGLSSLRIDKDSDGQEDFHLQPKVGEPVVFDTTAPITTHELSGTEGKNDWYVSDVMVTLSAEDNESGVGETVYSTDNGSTWTVYTEPFTIEKGNYTDIRYFSRNTQGMKEDEHAFTVAIDRTIPEAWIRMNSMQEIDVIETTDQEGRDTMITRGDDNITVSDAAGHSLDIHLSKSVNEGGHVSTWIDSIARDGIAVDTPETFLRYNFLLKKDDREYRMLSGFIRNGTDAIQTKYQSKENVTSIVHKTMSEDEEREDEGEAVSKETRQGVIIPGLYIGNEQVSIYY